MADKKGIILLSGGLDSATTAAYALSEGYGLSAVTFFYDQKHDIEISCAERLARFFNIEDHRRVNIPSEMFKSALVKGSGTRVPKNREQLTEAVPDTYVPARNILFLSYCLAYGESIGAYEIFIGANAVDYSGYPDCRPEFFEAYAAMANIGTKAGIDGKRFRIHAPLLTLTKAEIILLGTRLGLDYSLTHSCYEPLPDGRSCGQCDSCIIRQKGFAEAGIVDPAESGR